MNGLERQEQLRELQRQFNQIARTEKERRKQYNDKKKALRKTRGKLTHRPSKPSQTYQ